jgi:uncharacterized protein
LKGGDIAVKVQSIATGLAALLAIGLVTTTAPALARGGDVPSVASPGNRYATQDVAFDSVGITLRGTLYLPTHPVAAVVLVHGSGQEKRMAGFAARLASTGIVALTYDKRGVGASGGVYVGPEVGTNNVDPANLDLLARDANAAVRTLTGRLGVLPGKIGLLGFSQAGWVIPLAVAQNRSIKFMVMFSGPMVTTLEQLRFQFHTADDTNYWDTHDESVARKHVAEDPDRYRFTPTDPRDALARAKIPGLWIYGAKDIQIPVGLCIERLGTLKKAGKRFDHRLFPMLGHNTGFAEDDEPLLTAIAWITARAGR